MEARIRLERRRYLLGCGLLFSVVCLWVLSSFIMNSMFTSMDYNKPFLITYLCTSTFCLYLARPALQHLSRTPEPAPTSIHEPVGSYLDQHGVLVMRPDFAIRTRSNSRSMSRSRLRPHSVLSTDPPLTTQQTASLALAFCGLWFGANWSMNAALGYTSVSSTTILSSMSGFFTLGIGACAGVERFTSSKMISVILSIVGVIIVSQGDHEILTGPGSDTPKGPSPTLPSAPLLGDSLALASALAYAFYVILLKVRIKNETRVSMTLFFGFVGAWNIVLIWPLGLVLHYTQIETWQWPSGGVLWASIAINAAITFVSDALYLRAMLMTSPLAVTLGMSLTIPFAMAGDIYRGTQFGSWKVYIGGALVLCSFVANGLMDLREKTDSVESPAVVEGGGRRGSIEGRGSIEVNERQSLLKVVEGRIEEGPDRGSGG